MSTKAVLEIESSSETSWRQKGFISLFNSCRNEFAFSQTLIVQPTTIGELAMKRLTLKLGLLLALSPAGLAFAQDRDPAGPPREGARRDGDRPREGGDRPREGGDRPREGFGRGEGGPGRMMARLPIMMALDADQDGEISSKEIDMATVALKKLDKNGDGKITMEEMMPNFEGMGPGGFGGGPGGGPGGFGGGPGGNPQEMVNRLMEGDKDNDGYLAESELPERMRAMIERADANGDKKLSREELTTVAQRLMQGGRGEGRGPEGRGPEGRGP